MISETEKNIATAEAYYLAMARKDVSGIAELLHPEVEFVAPLGQSKGREALVEASKNFVTAFSKLTIYSKFGKEDQTVIVYELMCPAPVGKIRAVSLMNFKFDLIARVELFYDPRPFLNS